MKKRIKKRYLHNIRAGFIRCGPRNDILKVSFPLSSRKMGRGYKCPRNRFFPCIFVNLVFPPKKKFSKKCSVLNSLQKIFYSFF